MKFSLSKLNVFGGKIRRWFRIWNKKKVLMGFRGIKIEKTVKELGKKGYFVINYFYHKVLPIRPGLTFWLFSKFGLKPGGPISEFFFKWDNYKIIFICNLKKKNDYY